jgi:8-oxo-dGTP pyrophosphatase MutT (NUDIX family)
MDVPARRAGGDQYIPRPPSWSDAPLRAWQLDTATSAAHLAHAVVAAAGAHDVTWPDDAPLSAVLILLADGAHGPEVLLTKRPLSMRRHAGEISFPGGRIEPDETAEQAALREAWEEVGLDPDLVTVTGRLPWTTTHRWTTVIIPIVASVPSRPALVAHDVEVERIVWVPLAELGRADTYRGEAWLFEGDPVELHFFYLDDETVWGATARLLTTLLDLAAGGDATGPVGS